MLLLIRDSLKLTKPLCRSANMFICYLLFSIHLECAYRLPWLVFWSPLLYTFWNILNKFPFCCFCFFGSKLCETKYKSICQVQTIIHRSVYLMWLMPTLSGSLEDLQLVCAFMSLTMMTWKMTRTKVQQSLFSIPCLMEKGAHFWFSWRLSVKTLRSWIVNPL